MVVRSDSVGDVDGRGEQAVRLAQRRSSARRAAALARRAPVRGPTFAGRRRRRRYHHRYRRLPQRAGRPDESVLERRRGTAADICRHQRLLLGQERRVLSATGCRTGLATLTMLLPAVVKAVTRNLFPGGCILPPFYLFPFFLHPYLPSLFPLFLPLRSDPSNPAMDFGERCQLPSCVERHLQPPDMFFGL